MRLFELASAETEDRFADLLRASTRSSIANKPQLWMSREGGDGISDLGASHPIPALGHKYSPKPGNFKPEDGFWTSTGKETPDGWTSEWTRWVKREMSDWFCPKGVLYYPKAGAKILTVNTDADFEEIYNLYVDLTNAKHPDIERDMGFMKMHKNFPWPWVAQHWDAVHTENPSRSGMFTNPWDVESTVWFNTGVLGKAGDVEINPLGSEVGQ